MTAAATKDTVLARMKDARYMHLATHGFLDRVTTAAQTAVNPHFRESTLLEECEGGGTHTAEALRAAMLATRAKYPDPFNWAAFVLVGKPD